MTRDRRARNGQPRGSGQHAGAGDYEGSDPYAVPDERYGRDDYAPADSYAGQDGYDWDSGHSPADVRDAYARDAYAQANHYGAPDGRVARGGYPPEDDYAPPDDGYAPADRYDVADGQDAYAPAGPYQEHSARYDEPDGYRQDDGYARDDYPAYDQYQQSHGQYQQSYGPDDANQDDLYVSDSDDQQAGYHAQDRYRDQAAPGWHPGEEDDGPDGSWPDPGQQQPPREDGDHPPDWDEAPSREGFIPGLAGRDAGRGKKRRKKGRVLAPLLALVLLAVVTVGGYEGYKKIHLHSADFAGPGTGQVTVQVEPGDTATSLAPRLVTLGVVASVNSFVAAAKASTNPDGLQPGFFNLRHHMNSALAYKLLTSPSARMQTVVTIPEGLRLTQILTLLEQKLGKSMPANAFQNAVKDTAALGLPSYANGNLEGYLFPATYQIQPGTSALGVLQMMVARYNQEAAGINLSAAAQTGQLTPAR